MKFCKSCQTDLPDTSFEYRGGNRNGLQAQCKACSIKRARDYRQNMRNLVGRWKLRKGCQLCSFKAAHPCQLDLDHLDPTTKTYKGAHKAYDAGWSKTRVKSELAKCQVVCKNCHALRTYQEQHWKNFHTSVRMR